MAQIRTAHFGPGITIGGEGELNLGPIKITIRSGSVRISGETPQGTGTFTATAVDEPRPTGSTWAPLAVGAGLLGLTALVKGK